MLFWTLQAIKHVRMIFSHYWDVWTAWQNPAVADIFIVIASICIRITINQCTNCVINRRLPSCYLLSSVELWPEICRHRNSSWRATRSYLCIGRNSRSFYQTRMVSRYSRSKFYVRGRSLSNKLDYKRFLNLIIVNKIRNYDYGNCGIIHSSSNSDQCESQ